MAYQEASLGRVLVRKENRGQGIAEELIGRALDFIRNDLKETTIKIQAQAYLQKLYCSC
ncbi:GNAT family N-acetyltransferase [Paenibacillus alginolyticus]|uniref:GNAT family N-acetyltransferase n=1 Tax=Paenibacillus alginolyticus TaxID=59839 RepID=UPI003990AB39